MRALLVHGAGGGAWEWAAWEAALCAAGIAPEALELVPVAAGLEATRYEDYLAQVLAAGEGCSALIGASLGALLALEAAPGLGVRTLVLVNPLPPAPWHRLLPPRAFPPCIRWSRTASVAGTRRAMPDAEEALVRGAARRWRDESGAALAAAWSGRAVSIAKARVLAILAEADEDLPLPAMHACAHALGAETWTLPRAGHLSPLLGRDAPVLAQRVAEWLVAVTS